MRGLTDLERRYVQPFYLTMMRLNALRSEVPLDTLRDAARQLTDDDVTLLLNTAWRPRVLGAWFASGRGGRLETALLRSLETLGGSLTAPPLATVTVRELTAIRKGPRGYESHNPVTGLPAPLRILCSLTS
jgi:hypothetical protein